LIFKLGDQLLYAHTFIIQCTNKKLYEIIKEYGKEEDGKIAVDLSGNEKISSFGVFYTFILYLYTSSITFKQDLWTVKRFDKLLKLSYYLECDVLVQLLEDRLTLEEVDKSNFQIIMKTKSIEFITGNMDKEEYNRAGVSKFVFKDGNYLYAHNGLLKNRCSYFKGLFNFTEGSVEKIMNETDSYLAFKNLFVYFYSGLLCEIAIEEIINLYLTLHMIEVDYLKPYLRSLIKVSIDMDCVFSIINLAEVVNDENLLLFCSSFLVKNFENAKQIDDFKNLSNRVLSMVYKINNKKK
jgi:hypothetical protein